MVFTGYLHFKLACIKAQEELKHITITRLFKYTENFTTKKRKCSDKKLWYFYIAAQKIDCGYALEPPRRGGSNKYPQSMFLSRNKKNNVYPCKPQFYYIKVGFKGGQNYIGVFSWWAVKASASALVFGQSFFKSPYLLNLWLEGPYLPW